LVELPELDRRVTCVDGSTGQEMSTHELPGLSSEDAFVLLPLAAGSGPKVLFSVGPQNILELIELRPGGGYATLFHKADFELECHGENAAGDTLVIGLDYVQGAETATLLDAAGAVIFGPTKLTGSVCRGNGEQVRLMDDRTALLFGLVNVDALATTVQATMLSATGEPRWSRILAGDWNWASSAVRDGFAYVATGKYPLDDTPANVATQVFRISLADGHDAWDASSLSPPPPPELVLGRVEGRFIATPRVWLEAGSNRLLFAAPDGKGVQFREVDAETGIVQRASARTCGGPSCTIATMEIDALGRLQVAASLDVAYGQGALALFRRDHPFDVGKPYARVDQPALEGAWYAPASTGQGLVYDYIDAAGTTFWTWFTFTGQGGLALGAQRWYTLQGSLPTTPTSPAQLEIFRNAGGEFASPPATAAERVGRATLVFPACDLAEIHYTFDAGENAGASGAVSLRPLTPTGAACAAVGAPVPDATTSAHGFDTRQSGTWYVPGSGGQGFSFVVRPGAQGDYLFGAWFTYDPLGSADDPAAQHWFTLQGSLANATDGTVALTIWRTIGGSFADAPTRDTYRVGSAVLHFTGCGSATLDYQFDSSEVTASFVELNGHLDLTGLGTCP
jgi:hypothetical protein